MKSRAFSLIELLVAMAVLAMVLVLISQATNGILQSTRIQTRHMDAVSTARRAMDVIAQDLRLAVINDQLGVLVPTTGTDRRMLFLTSRRGPASATDHRFLALRYDYNPGAGELRRPYRSVPATDNITLGSLDDGTFVSPSHPLADGVLGFSLQAIDETGQTHPMDPANPSPNWASADYNGQSAPPGYAALITAGPSFTRGLEARTRAIEISIAAVDQQMGELIREGNFASAVQSAVSGAPKSWRETIDQSNELPGMIKAGIRILRKTIPLP